jgi:tripartite-type tricarboxylate transporter receptor subunit TctC
MKKILLIAVILGWALPAAAQAPFYQDKNIVVVLGGPPSGSADLRTRGVINVWRRHIPGNPNIVMQYMGGGGGRQAANHVFGVAKPDGLTVGSMGAALVTNAVLGATGVQYDIDKLTYLGTPDSASAIAMRIWTRWKSCARPQACA